MYVSHTAIIARYVCIRLVFIVLAATAIMSFLLSRDSGPAYAATYMVNSADDVDDGTCDTTHCSLREAILAANASSGTDLITFSIGSGLVTISPSSALPSLTQAATIDGTAQPGYAGSPLVQIDGAAAGSTTDGLLMATSNAVVRGLSITSFGRNGITINGGMGNFIVGNWIGISPSGAAAGNGGHGITIGSSWDNTIGGTSSSDRNVISANGGSGVSLVAGGIVNRLRGNYIGTDTSGMSAMGNAEAGVRIVGDNNLIGGTLAGARNVISGNLGDGVAVVGAFTTQNGIVANYIGLAADGVSPLGNRHNGVLLDNAVGHNGVGTAASAGGGNRIAYNARNGVFVQSGTGHPIIANSIFANGGLGIDLFDAAGVWGVITPNDPGDVDTGANNLQNYPVLTDVVPSGGSVTITGLLDSNPSTTFSLEFFANGECRASNGEGESYLGAANVTTDGTGAATFTVTLPAGVVEGQWVTATARDPSSNTSEFSPCQYAGLLPTPTETPTETPTDTPVPTRTPVPATDTPIAPSSTPPAPTATPALKQPAPAGLCGLADLDGDGKVNGRDVSAMVHELKQGRNDPTFDLNDDGRVNGTDINLVTKCELSGSGKMPGH